jgi:hypothetical protein
VGPTDLKKDDSTAFMPEVAAATQKKVQRREIKRNIVAKR